MRLPMRRLLLVLHVLLAIAQLVALVSFARVEGLPLDDAWIHQVVARTFAETGTLGYAPGEHGAAATSYLWAALLAFNFEFLHVDPVRWAFVLELVSSLAMGQLLFAVLLGSRPKEIGERSFALLAFGASLVACIGPNVIWFAHSGMEACPFLALSLACAFAIGGEKPTTKTLAIGGVVCGLLALLRPEAIPLGLVLAAYVMWRQRDVRKTAYVAVPWVASVAIYIGSNVVKTGHAMPSTLSGRRWLWFEGAVGLSSIDRIGEWIDSWVKRLSTWTFGTSTTVGWILVGLALYGAYRLVRVKNDRARILVAWALMHSAFYAVMLPTHGHGGRYQPFVPFLFAACVVAGTAFALTSLASLVRESAPKYFGAYAVVAVIPWIVLLVPPTKRFGNAQVLAVAHIQATEIGMGSFVDRLPPEREPIASFDIGGIGWATKKRIVDAGGLSDPNAARLLEEGRIWEYLKERNVRTLVLPATADDVLPFFDDYSQRLTLAGNPVVELEPIFMLETPHPLWEPGITATWNSNARQIAYAVTYTDTPPFDRGPKVAASAKRAIGGDPSLVPDHDRRIAEHMLAVLEAWDTPIDLRVVAKRELAPPSTGGCAITIGFWGVEVDSSCARHADPTILRALLYQYLTPFFDAGDLGGAARATPHIIARARRTKEPSFRPMLAPLAHPILGGRRDAVVAPLLLLVVAIAASGVALEQAAARRARILDALATLIARVRAPSAKEAA